MVIIEGKKENENYENVCGTKYTVGREDNKFQYEKTLKVNRESH
jgi:hypothetical protein